MGRIKRVRCGVNDMLYPYGGRQVPRVLTIPKYVCTKYVVLRTWPCDQEQDPEEVTRTSKGAIFALNDYDIT